MKHTGIRRQGRVLVAAVAVLALAAMIAASATHPQPTVTSDPAQIVVVLDDAYPPYSFRTADGALSGILPDLWRIWEAKTGVAVELVATNWAAAQTIMKAGQADVIDTMFKTHERQILYDFLPPYARLEVPVFAHRDLGGIADVRSLKGFTVGVKAGDAVIDRLAEGGIVSIVEYESYEAIILAAKRGDIKVFSVDAPPAVYFMALHGITYDFNTMFVLYTGNFHRAVAKGDARMAKLVGEGFDQISPRERHRVERRWLGTPFSLTPLLRQWRLLLSALAGLIVALVGGTAVLGALVRARTAKLAEWIARYNALSRQNGIVTWEVDREGLYTHLSEETWEIAGYASKTLVNRAHFYELHPEEGREAFKEKFLRSIQTGEAFRDVIHPLMDSRGGIVWLQSFSIPLRGADGSIRGAWGTSADVTQRVEADLARKESERNYRTLAESMMDVVWILDADTLAFTYLSPSVEQLLGAPPEVFLGRPARECFSQTEGLQLEKYFRGLLADFRANKTAPNDYFTREIPLRRLDGRTIVTEAVGRLWLDKETGRLEIHGSSRDVTQRRQIEDDLRESRRQHAALLAHLPGMAYRCSNNRQWSMSFISSGCFELTGYTPDELIGDKVVSFNDLICPEHRERLWERWQKALAEHKRFDSEYEIVTKSGTVRWVFEKGEGIFNEQGQVVALEGFIMDITDRKLAEAERERLLWTIEQSSDAIIITNAEGTIRYVNPAFERITGYTSQEAIGQNPRFLRSGLQDQAFYDALWSTLHQGRNWEGRMINKRKDGTVYTEQATISPARAPNGGIVGFISIKRDISREIESEQEKAALQAQLAQSQRLESIGLLAGGVAHDFNNMLQAIIGYSEMALEGVRDDQAPLRDDLAEIRKVALRSTLLTRQLLTFARRQPTEPKPIDVNQGLAAMTGMLDRLLGDGIRLAIDTAVDAGVVVIDPGQFEQIILNLCINARDAIDTTGSVQIATEVVVVDPACLAQFDGVAPGTYVRISVKDSGRGIPADIQSRIFEPFFSTKPLGKGSGLGLAVVYGIVTQAGGAIRLHSEEGKGAVFQIYLPRSGSAPAAAAPAEEVHPESAPAANILLVDDESLILRPTHTLLTNLGHQVVAANSPLDAVRIFAERHAHIDLLISDVAMPDMSGPQLLAKLRETKPDLKCLFMSGHSADHLGEGDLGDLHAEFIQKPFTKAELASAVTSILKD